MDMLLQIASVLPSLICLLWAVILLLHKRGRNRAKYSLALFMAVAALLYACHAAYFNHFNSIYFDILYIGANLSVYPLYLLYIRKLTSVEPLSGRSYLIFIVPTVAMAITAVLYAVMPIADAANFIEGYLYGLAPNFGSAAAELQILWHRATPVIFAAEVVYVLILGTRSIVGYHENLKRFYSSDKGRSLRPIKNLLVMFVVTSALSMTVNLIGKAFFADQLWLLIIPSLIFSAALFTLGLAGFRQNFSAEDLAAEMPAERVMPKISAKRHSEISERIAAMFETELVYRNSDYKITDLAAAIGTNRTYISNIINTDFGCNFSDYVNRYRVAHAKRLLAEQRHTAMSVIFEEAGFASESSFYRIFKEQTGQTPSEYLRSL